MAEPNHPAMAQFVDILPRWNRFYGTKYPTVMFSTGPAFVDLQLMRFIASRRTLRDAREGIESTRTTDLIDILENYGGSDSFFYHVEGSSWHADDAQLVLWLFDRGKLILMFGSLLGIGLVALVISRNYFCNRRNKLNVS
jgi:hypothetical protein